MANTKSTTLVSATPSYWSRADTASLSITGSITVSVWVKFNTLPVSGSTYPRLVYKYGFNGDAANQRSYALTAVGDGGQKLDWSMSSTGAGGDSREFSWSPSTGVWYHIVAVYDTSVPNFKMYVDGSQIGTTQTGVPASIYDGTSTFAIGADGFSGDYLNGLVDDVRIWARALDATEVGDLYTDPCNFDNGSNLAAWWEFEDNGNDSSGNSNTLTNINSATFTTDVPYTCSVATTNPAFLLNFV